MEIQGFKLLSFLVFLQQPGAEPAIEEFLWGKLLLNQNWQTHQGPRSIEDSGVGPDKTQNS